MFCRGDWLAVSTKRDCMSSRTDIFCSLWSPHVMNLDRNQCKLWNPLLKVNDSKIRLIGQFGFHSVAKAVSTNCTNLYLGSWKVVTRLGIKIVRWKKVVGFQVSPTHWWVKFSIIFMKSVEQTRHQDRQVKKGGGFPSITCSLMHELKYHLPLHAATVPQAAASLYICHLQMNQCKTYGPCCLHDLAWALARWDLVTWSWYQSVCTELWKEQVSQHKPMLY